MDVGSDIGNRLEVAVEKWLTQSLSRVTPDRAVSNHIDEILERKIPISEFIEISTNAFCSLVRQLLRAQMPVKPGLVIPLESVSVQVTQSVPQSRVELESQLTREPPSLYLVDWEISKYQALREEYHAPLPFQLVDESPDKIYVYYTEVRWAREIEDNEEFLRRVYAEYYPLGIRVD